MLIDRQHSRPIFGEALTEKKWENASFQWYVRFPPLLSLLSPSSLANGEPPVSPFLEEFSLSRDRILQMNDKQLINRKWKREERRREEPVFDEAAPWDLFCEVLRALTQYCISICWYEFASSSISSLWWDYISIGQTHKNKSTIHEYISSSLEKRIHDVNLIHE